MGRNKPKFGKLLEQYVFSIAEKFIGLVDSKTQTGLIRLFSSINKELPLIIKQSKAETKAIKIMATRQITIETTLSYIVRIDILLEKAEKTIPNTARTIALISRYLSLKNKYSVALIKDRTLQQKDINRLEGR